MKICYKPFQSFRSIKLQHGIPVRIRKNTDHGLDKGFFGLLINQSESRIPQSHIINRIIDRGRGLWNIALANFLYFSITYGKLIPLPRKRYQFSVRNGKIHKISNFNRVIFFAFYNNPVYCFVLLKILSIVQLVHL